MPDPGSPGDMHGRICLITGSSRGIGKAVAGALGRVGADVIINGRNGAACAQTADDLHKQGVSAHSCPFDITDQAAVAENLARIEQEIGPLNVVVNNAGTTIRKPFEAIQESDWDAVLDLNLKAAFFVSQAAARFMVPRKAGKIIMIASLMSEGARPTILPYTVSKGGMKMLIKALTVELAQHNIQVNGIGPGYIETELTTPLMDDPEFDAWVKKRTPAGKWGTPEDLGGAAVFLACGMSDFVNGQVIYVDGGWLAGF